MPGAILYHSAYLDSQGALVCEKLCQWCHITVHIEIKPPRVLLTSMEPSADTSRHGTRPKNKSQHPGAVDIAAKRKRRTQAEIAADNAAKEATKTEEARKAHEQIKTIASLEGEMAKKDADANSAHPRNRNGDVHILVTCPNVND